MKIGLVSQDIGFHALEGEQEDGAAGFTYPGGSAWYRLLQPAHHSGVEHVTGQLGQRNGILVVYALDTDVCHEDCDIVVLQRCIWPGLPEAIATARSNGQVVLNDMDDWLDNLPPSNKAFASMTDHKDTKLIYRKVLSNSDGIICSTPFLADWYGRYAPTALWRNSIDFDSFPVRREHMPEDPSIGWFGSLRFRDLDVEQLAGIMSPFVQRHGLQFVHVGHEAPKEAPKRDILKPMVRDRESSVSYRSLAERMRMPDHLIDKQPPIPFILSSVKLHDAYDIGVIPLAPTNFNDAKSCLKGIEHIASGIPYVASPSAEYRWLAEHGIGRVARKPKDWQRHLSELLDVDQRREDIAEMLPRLRDLVDINTTGPAWLDIVKSWA